MLRNSHGDLLVDNTILSAFSTCSTRAMVLYGYDLEPVGNENMPAKAGQAIHSALETYLVNGSLDMALDRFNAEYAGTEVPEGDRLEFGNVQRIIYHWMLDNPPASLPFEVIETELPFEIPLVPGINYVGRIDAIVRPRHSNKLLVLDHKATGRLDALFKRQFTLSSQMSGYVWAAQQIFAPKRISGIWINAIDVSVIPSSNRSCRKHPGEKYIDCGIRHLKHEMLGPYYRSPRELQGWYQDAVQLAEAWRDFTEAYGDDYRMIQSVPQEGRWQYQACVMCPVHEFCTTGRKPGALRSTMQKRQWTPLTETEDGENS